MNLKIFCDGGARGNPGPAAWGFSAVDDSGKTLVQKSGKIGIATNNVAEYTAVIEALDWLNKNLQTNGLRMVQFYLDSELVVLQLNGIYKVKNSKLRELVARLRALEAPIAEKISYTHISRENNSRADALVNQALDA